MQAGKPVIRGDQSRSSKLIFFKVKVLSIRISKAFTLKFLYKEIFKIKKKLPKEL